MVTTDQSPFFSKRNSLQNKQKEFYNWDYRLQEQKLKQMKVICSINKMQMEQKAN